MSEPVEMRETVRAYCLREHPHLIEQVLDCADAVAAETSDDGGEASDGVGKTLERRLRVAGVVERLPDLLTGAVASVGRELPAPPVAAPPYVVVTGVGPIARATLRDGRLVITVEAFRRNAEGYVRGAISPEEALSVEVHRVADE